MASDRSRFSFDEAQRYRSVIVQQGRVLLDSDLNEAQDILAEETRVEALDFVGPSGTPDDGYKISIPSPAANFDFGIGAGTMYVGGIRVSIPGDPAAKTPPFSYSKQPEWLAPTSAALTGAAKEYVWLELIEHEVSALEDRALLEPALGGPDTAARRRILQRIRRSSTSAATCGDAKKAQVAAWASEGRTLDDGGRLRSFGRLQVSPVAAKATSNPCDPIAHGGYLGAENQLIRVRITGPSTFVWAFDDASALYRISELRGGNQLVVVNLPVDDAHRPKSSQVAELLPAAARLGNGEVVTEPYGKIFKQTADYNVDDHTLTVAALPAGLKVDNANALFVRIWESELNFTANNPVELQGTGLQVTLTLDGGAAFADGDFWAFAVRPQAPSDVYPARYGLAPQPPEGPRRWACGLAVLDWTSATAGTIADNCRPPFENLVELTARKTDQNSCCSATVTPADVVNGSLQPVLDRASKSPNFKICFLPGLYALTDPIVLTSDHTSVTFEGCRGGVVIAGNGAKMKDGLVQIVGGTDITFTGIQFRLPFVLLGERGSDRARVGIALGIRMIDANLVTVDDCDFVFPPAGQLDGITAALGAGILSNGAATSLTVRDSTFTTARSRNAQASVTYVGIAAVPGFFADAIVRPPVGPAGGGTILTNLSPNLAEARVTEAPQAATVVTRQAQPQAAVPAAPVITPGPATTPVSPRPIDVLVSPALTPGAVPVNQPGPAATPVSPRPIDVLVSPVLTPGVVPVNPDLPPRVIVPPVFFDPPFISPPVAPKATVTANGSMLPASVNGFQIIGNRFSLCQTAVLLCADVSALRIEDNDVDRAQSGFVIISSRWIPAVAFLSVARLNRIFLSLVSLLLDAEKNQHWNAVQAAAELVATFAHPDNATLLSALVSIELPAPQKANPALVTLTDGLDENGWVLPLEGSAVAAFTAGPSSLDLFDAGRAGVATELQRRVTTAWAQSTPSSLFVNQVAAGLGFGSLLQRQPSATLSLQFQGNVVRTFGGGASGSALFVMDDHQNTSSTATIAGNRLLNNSVPLPTAVAAFVSRCDVTGNIVQNESVFNWSADTNELRLFWSLIAIPGLRPPDKAPAEARGWTPPLVAVMSNVFKGWPVLPPRPMPGNTHDPLDSWLLLNTVSW